MYTNFDASQLSPLPGSPTDIVVTERTQSANDSFTPPIRLISIDRVRTMLGLKNAAIYEKVARGELPAPIKFGTSRRAAARWIEHEILLYIMEKAAQRPSRQSRHSAC